MPTLRISLEKICYIVVKAREFDVKVAPEWLDDGSNPTDDGMTRIRTIRPSWSGGASSTH